MPYPMSKGQEKRSGQPAMNRSKQGPVQQKKGGFYMFQHSTKAASCFSVLIVALIFSLALAGVAAAQFNTSLGTGALASNTTGQFNTASGFDALFSNTTGSQNTASGVNALVFNTIGNFNPASGVNALLSNTTGNG